MRKDNSNRRQRAYFRFVCYFHSQFYFEFVVANAFLSLTNLRKKIVSCPASQPSYLPVESGCCAVGVEGPVSTCFL